MESQTVAGAPRQGPGAPSCMTCNEDGGTDSRDRVAEEKQPLMGSVSAEQRGTALKVTACPPPLAPVLEPASSAML